jgi:hypothetical protein
MCYRINRLCTDPKNVRTKLQQFDMRLNTRRYKASEIKPLFLRDAETEQKRALQQQSSTPTTAKETPTDDKPVTFFHVQYHPDGPKSRDIQHIWWETLSTPEHCHTWTSYPSHAGTPIVWNA